MTLSNIYKLLDQVLETGEPLEIERKGQTLKIVPPTSPHKLDRLPSNRGYLGCDPEEIVHLDWTGDWNP
nr:type II toxin-antitoxin system Phd/YefM family antitoxin [Desulfobulbaceae bacterium]